jgi:hypothetical protein
MVGRMRFNWRLVGATFQVLRRNTDLLIFPIVGLLALGLVIALWLGSILVWADFQIDVVWAAPLWEKMAAVSLFYLFSYFVVFSANTALIGTAMLLLEGKQPTLLDGWRIAYTHKSTIFTYALLMATVGLLLRLLSRWVGQVGRFAVPMAQRVIIFAGLGLAWHVVPVLVIPVLIAEEIDPVAAIRRSSQLVTHTWGEGVVQNANLWLIFILPLVLILAAGAATIVWISRNVQEVWMTATLYVVVMLITLIFLIGSALTDIFSVVIYRYTRAMPIPDPFEPDMLSNAFHSRPSRILRFIRRRWSALTKRGNTNHVEVS